MDEENPGMEMWLLGLWAAGASDARPRCPQPRMTGWSQMEAARRLAASMREILRKLARPRKTEDVERVERVLKRIEREAHDEGFRDPRMLTQLFKPDDQKIIDRMYDNWWNYRNNQGTGKLDRAFAS